MIRAINETLPAVEADIISSPFEDNCTERKIEYLTQKRYFVKKELFLKIFGICRNHHTLSCCICPKDSREKISDGFPCAGACFGKQYL